MASVSLRKLKKSYGSLRIVKGVDPTKIHLFDAASECIIN